MTTNAAATKTKTRKIGELSPPRDIVDNTKLRRAWCAEQVAANTSAGKSAKVIGKGSYETVALYEHTEVEGRERFRGNCQVCGGAQVVDGGKLVLHGYNRPGYGYVVGRCPGTAEVPLQVSDALTMAYRMQAREQLAALETVLAAATIVAKQAGDALYPRVDGRMENAEPGAYAAAPKLVKANRWSEPTADEQAAYDAARAEWAKQWPLTAANSEAKRAEQEAQTNVHKAGGWLRHLNDLLALNLVGTPLQREVVA